VKPQSSDLPTPSNLHQRIAELLEAHANPKRVTIKLISSINLPLFPDYLRLFAAQSGIELSVQSGSFDNPVDDSNKIVREPVDFAVFVPSIDPYAQGASGLGGDEFAESEAIKWALAIRSLPSNCSAVLCLPASLNGAGLAAVGFSVSTNRFRDAIRGQLETNSEVAIVDVDMIVKEVGLEHSVDMGPYMRASAPFSVAAMAELSRRISFATREFGTRFFKAVVVDCDNTLWGGVVGELGPEGISIDPSSYPGNVYWRIQHLLKALRDRGLLLCIASKNETVDVLTAFRERKEMVLHESDFAVINCAWVDKPTMISGIAQQLNIGVDSLVFIDDSPFECESVARAFPRILVQPVPPRLVDYVPMMERLCLQMQPFFDREGTIDRTAIYRAMLGAEISNKAETHEDFLASLGIKLSVHLNELRHQSRLTEMAQKTNQFNTTTVRFTKQEIQGFLESSKHDVWSFSVQDRMADQGVTGLAIAEIGDTSVRIISLMLSCRILGRGIERAILASLCSHYASLGIHTLEIEYKKTVRNVQVLDFLREHAPGLEIDDSGHAIASMVLVDSVIESPTWIEVMKGD